MTTAKETDINYIPSLGRPFFSVVVLSFRHDEYLKDAIDSVFNQSISNELYEVIIVAKSNGPAREILGEVKSSKRINIINDDDFPQGKKISLALKVSRGEWVSIIEDDDIWLKERLSILLEIISKSKEDLNFIHNSSYVIIGKEKEKLFEQTPERQVKDTFTFSLDKFSHFGVFSACDHNASSIIFKREAIIKNDSYIKCLEGGIDTFLFVTCLLSGGVGMCTERRLTLFRIAENPPSSAETISNLKRQLQGFGLIRDLANTAHNKNVHDFISTKIAENKIKINLLNEDKNEAKVTLTDVFNYIRSPLFQYSKRMILLLIFAIRCINKRIAIKLYKKALTGTGGTLGFIKAHPVFESLNEISN